MYFSSQYVLLCIVLISINPWVTLCISIHPLIFIVSYDGFRHNYISEKLTPTLYSLRKEGTYADHMINVFPTKTYTNHHSIITGLYAEQHGVLDNKIWDPVTSQTVGYSEKLFVQDRVWPLTVLNEFNGNGRYSGSMMWPGTDYAFNGHTITHKKLFNRSIPWTTRIDEALSWYLDKKKPANIVFLYIDEPDTHGHMFGSEANKTLYQIRRVDTLTKHIFNKIESMYLSENVNVFLMSDHGMSSVSVKHLINLTHYIDTKYVQFGGGSPTLEIFPKDIDKEIEIFTNLSKAADELKTFKVYRKFEIPDRLKYKNHIRSPPLLAVAEPQYAFQDVWKDFQWFAEYNRTVTNDSIVGIHGYDNLNSDMWPFFLAVGPDIKKNYSIKPFNNIDLFQLWISMSKINIAPNSILSEGKLNNVNLMLNINSGSSVTVLTYVIIGLVILVTFVIILGVYERYGGGMIRMSGASLSSSIHYHDCTDRPSASYRPLPHFNEDSEESDENFPRVHLEHGREANNLS